MAVLPTGIGPVTGGYQIERSLRFNSADSAYLNKTFSTTPTNRAKKTVSFWYKRSNLSSTQNLFSSYNGGGQDGLYITSGDSLSIYAMNGGASGTVNGVLRDVSAWYHIVYVIDTTQATAGDRLKIWINGVNFPSASWTSYSAPSLNSTADILFFQSTEIGRDDFSSSGYLNGYLTETYFIDGQALTPSSFGETDSNTGVWKPKAYSGTYGTNGFYLKFADNSGTTSTTLGKDSSGNGNNWTPNNFSVTAGTGNDSLVDSPTSYGTDTGVGGEVRGNYATLNPLFNSYPNQSNGNLNLCPSSDNVWNQGLSSIVVNTGKWYFEATIGNTTSSSFTNGIGIQVSPIYTAFSRFLGSASDSYGGLSKSAGITGYTNNSAGTSLTNALSSGSVLRCAVDIDAGKVWIGDSTSYIGGGSPASGTSATYTFTANSNVALGVNTWGTGNTTAINFGQRAFAYTAPSGFKALCTQNLPTPTIGATSTTQANDYMNVVTYTGNGSTQSITGVGFQPDWTWIKIRNAAGSHALADAVRGSTIQLASNNTDAEITRADTITSFASDGFNLGANTTGYSVNINAQTYVAWNWKANGAGSSNTAGTITSTVSANTTSGFSVVTYTGNGTTGATFGHGLGVTPDMVIIKKRSTGTAGNWLVYHTSTGINQYLYLNSTAAAATSSPTWGVSSTLVTLQQPFNDYNTSTAPYVAYCFAPVAGYSAFGSYTGNGSADGPFVYTGFRPRYILWKVSSGTTGHWEVVDTARETYNQSDQVLFASSSGAESAASSSYYMDILSNGFKIRNTDTSQNGNTYTYIYACFAETPAKFSLAR